MTAELEARGSVAFIGLGAMGMPMASRLLEVGVSVHAFDVAQHPRTVLAEKGANIGTSAANTVKDAQVVILMLPNSDVVENVAEQIRPALNNEALVVDMSSSEPLRTRALAKDLAPEVGLVDAPVSGGVEGAYKGALTIMAGGDAGNIERVRSLLSHFGTVKVAGAVGAGHAIKALNNLLSATHLWATTEVIYAGERFGLDPETMLDIINGSSGRSGSTETKWPNFIIPATYHSGFPLGLMLKDMRIAVSVARQVGLPSVLGEAAVECWSEAEESLSSAADHTEISRWISNGA